jgi:hypothetical protein
MKNSKIILALFATLILGLLIPSRAFCQTEKLGIVHYTPPKGMTKTPKENIVAFSEYNQTTGKYCIITLYGATPGTGNPTTDFTREWKNLVVKNMKAEANPTTETTVAEGWAIVADGSEVESDVGKAVGFLTVISGFEKTVSILAVFNDPAYVKQVDSFIGSIDLDKIAAPANNTTAAKPLSLDQYGDLIIPPPTRQITIADITGEWGEESGRISTNYVNRSDGSYAGRDSFNFRVKRTFTKDGGYLNDFFAIRNGEKIIDKTVGTVTITGRVLYLKHKDTAKYVIRGWLELPDMTILQVVGPWYNDQEIPEKIFTDFESAVNLRNNWVRKK